MKGNIDEDIRAKLASKHACFVLVTCDPPSKDGNMNVQLSFEGDPALASLMVQGAQSYLEEHEIERNIKNMN